MLPKSSAAGQMVYGIVVGGHDGDPAPDLSNNLKVYFPGLHGKDVKPEHLNFSPRIMSPTKSTQQEFPGGLDPGTLVIAMKDTGSNYCQILGMANDTNRADERIPGNIDLLQYVSRFLSTNIQVRQPPSIYETTENGVRVRKIREKGQHNHNLLRGLPTHGALYNLAGAPVPRVSGVATANQQYSNVLNANMLSSIPGTSMSLGRMFNLLNSANLMKDIQKNVPREIGQAINSMTNLIQSIESGEGAGFNVGGRVHQETYLKNATSLLGQSTNLSDVVSALSRLQTDSSLFGLDKLANSIINSALAFGSSQISISASGSIMRFIPPETKNAIDTASRALQMIESAVPGQKIFGDSSQQIFKMLNRLSPQSLTLVMAQITKLNSSLPAQVMKEVNRTTVRGGNPFTNL
jgi:hypothetical protein